MVAGLLQMHRLRRAREVSKSFHGLPRHPNRLREAKNTDSPWAGESAMCVQDTGAKKLEFEQKLGRSSPQKHGILGG